LQNSATGPARRKSWCQPACVESSEKSFLKLRLAFLACFLHPHQWSRGDFANAIMKIANKPEATRLPEGECLSGGGWLFNVGGSHLMQRGIVLCMPASP
jgi:hypothetical protein